MSVPVPHDSEAYKNINQSGWRLVLHSPRSSKPDIIWGRLVREFTFSNFNEAFGFMTKVALKAAQLHHYPDWTNKYNAVFIGWWSPDIGGVGTFDVELAEFCNKTWDEMSKK